MNAKIICSSGAMLKLLTKFPVDGTSDKLRKIEIFDGKIYIENAGFDVEHQNEIDQEYSDRQLRTLAEILNKIPEQPITLNFTDDWDGAIEILYAVITRNS